jgi:hypothetical protein
VYGQPYRGFESLSLRQPAITGRVAGMIGRPGWSREFVGPEPCALCHREPRQARKGATVNGPTQVPQVNLGPISASPSTPTAGF